MNYIKHLSAFFDKVSSDSRLNSSHISLYMALFQFWNLNRFVNPISINRGQVMNLSKIGSEHTYYRDLYDLHNWGYIEYLPSHNPMKGSLVNLCTFDTSSAVLPAETTAKMQLTGCNNDISTAQALHPSLNNINIINNKTYREEKSKKLNKDENQDLNQKNLENEKEKRKNLSQKKENEMGTPSLDEVIAFFKSVYFSEVEAQKFFNHFESNGWKVGGKSPMKNWQAAARNWILNSHNFLRQNHIQNSYVKPNPNGNKNYSEPL